MFDGSVFFFFNDTATTKIYTYLHPLSLHDALPIYCPMRSHHKWTHGYRHPARHSRPCPQAWRSCPDWLDSRSKRPWHDPCRKRSEEHTSELQSLMRISYAVFCLKKKKKQKTTQN